MKEHKYHWDDVIVGYSLSALIYAFYSGMPVIGYMSSAPWHFEKLRFEIDLSDYGMGKGTIRSEIELWNHLYTLLSMGGQMPFADNAESVRIEEDALVVTTHNRSRVIRGGCTVKWIFDDYKIEGMPPIIKPCEQYRVADWFDVRSGMKHDENQHMDPSEDFVRNIYFYPSARIDGNHTDKKDVCSESFLHENQLDDFEHSSTYARFKVIDAMKNLGIRGARNGIGSNGKPKHYALKIEFDKRQKKRVSMHTYKIRNDLIYNRVSPSTLLKECLYNSKAFGPPTPANPYIPKVLLTS
jgi:hypothetical protein